MESRGHRTGVGPFSSPARRGTDPRPRPRALSVTVADPPYPGVRRRRTNYAWRQRPRRAAQGGSEEPRWAGWARLGRGRRSLSSRAGTPRGGSEEPLTPIGRASGVVRGASKGYKACFGMAGGASHCDRARFGGGRRRSAARRAVPQEGSDGLGAAMRLGHIG